MQPYYISVTEHSKILCFGEALWDFPPGGRVPGGAPMNVALRLTKLGADVALLSRVGNDDAGRELLDYLVGEGLAIDAIQIDERIPTGRVIVDVADPLTPRFDIEEPAAWDFIEAHGDRAQPQFDVIVFGSLAARHDVSRASLNHLLGQARLKVFDANIRPPHSGPDLVTSLLGHADWVKLNDQELALISHWTGISGDLEQSARQLARKFDLQVVCITRGGDGAAMLVADQYFVEPGLEVNVVDTVGCGDSFLGCWLWQMLSGQSPQESLRRACAMGALVAAVQGGNPDITDAQIREILQPR